MKDFIFFTFFIFVSITISVNSLAETNYLSRPVRDVSIIASGDAYYPNHLSIFVGESLRLYLTTISPKGSCFYLEKTTFNSALKMGDIQSFVVNFTEPGLFFYYCPTTNIRGKIQVIRRPEDIKEEEEKNRVESKIRREGENWRPIEDDYFKYK